MNNWRLLLLAVVAVFQPIASFTESNLIDGRQQCCDRLSSAPFQDTRSSLHGTYRLGKTTSALQRLNDRDETRDDRRYGLRKSDSIFSRPSTESPLVNFRGRVVRQGPSEIARSSRVEYRLQRLNTNSPSYELQLDGHEREETARSVRDLKQQDITRRITDRTSRDDLERRNDRIYTGSPRNSLFRDEYRSESFGNERLSRNLFDSRREMHRQQIRSVDRRITLNRDARRVVSRTQDDVSTEASNNMNNRKRIVRERMSAVRRESILRPDTRRYSEHDYERQDLQRDNEQRPSLSANIRLVDRDMPNRLNDRKDTRENRQRIRTNQRISVDRFDDRREHREERRDTRQQNKENIERSTSGERRTEVAQRITRGSRIINVLNNQNDRNVDDRREIRHKRMSREIQNKIRENPEYTFTRERIQMDRRDIHESRVTKARNMGDTADRREIRQNERMTRETGGDNRDNLEQRLSRERIQMDRRDIRESRVMNARNTRDAAARRDIRQNERMTRETGDDNRDNLEQRLSRERIQMDRRDIRESRVMISRNTRDTADRREIRQNERMTRQTGDDNMDNLEQRLSRERIQMDRRDIRESRVMNARNTRDTAARRDIRHNERMIREIGDENRENQDQTISRERIQMDRRDIRESRVMNARNTRDAADRREIRQNERMTRETGDDNRDNFEQRLSRERIQMDRKDIRGSRLTRNTRDTADQREIMQDEKMTRETRDENRTNREKRFYRERIQMDRRDVRESRLVNARNTRDTADRREIRQNERMTREIGDDNRDNLEQRLSRERIQMDRRDIRESRNMNIAIRTERDVESQREIRTHTKLHTVNRESPDHILARERVVMDRRNTRESRIMNTLNVFRTVLGSSQITRESRETREKSRENSDRRLAQESRQVDRPNIQESRINRVTLNERSVKTDTESRREMSNNEKLSGQIRSYRATRERRVDSKSADRVNVEKDSSIADRRARSADRRNFREIRAKTRLSQSADSEPRSEIFRSRVDHSSKIENKEREVIDARSRNVDLARSRERNSVMVENLVPENDFTAANWQYVLYTLQAAYLCALFMQMLTPRRTEKAAKMSLRWLPVSSHYNPIKVD